MKKKIQRKKFTISTLNVWHPLHIWVEFLWWALPSHLCIWSFLRAFLCLSFLLRNYKHVGSLFCEKMKRNEDDVVFFWFSDDDKRWNAKGKESIFMFWHFFYLIWLRGIFGSFELDLQSLCSDLETVHRLNCRLRRCWIVERHETKAFAQICLFVDEHFRGYDMTEWHECGCQIRIGEFLR